MSSHQKRLLSFVAVGFVCAAIGVFAGRFVPSASPAAPSEGVIDWTIQAWDDQTNWKTFADSKSSLSFRAPNGLFLDEGEFVPTIKKTTCGEVDRLRASKDAYPRTCYGDRLCVNETADGAAGSSYVTYVLSVKEDGQCGTASFVIRYTNGSCGPYDSPGRERCAARQDHVRAELLPAIFSSFGFAK